MRKYCLYTLFILFIAASRTSSASDCLKFHVIENAPMGYLNTEQKLLGVHLEYLKALETETGFCIKTNLVPYPRIWKSIELGKHDGGIIFKSLSRSSSVTYVEKIRSVKTIIVAMKGTELSDYNDLKGLIIGKTRGTHLSKQFDNDLSLKIVELNNYGQAAKMIKLGRIDAIAGSALVLSYQLNKYNILADVDFTNKLILGEKEQWLQLSNKSKHLDKIPKLQQAIQQLKQDGSFDLIMNKYYGTDWKYINQ